MSDDLGTLLPSSGNLESWAKQGVLLLNASLTVREDTPNSHKHLKWNLYRCRNSKDLDGKEKLFFYFGKFAHKRTQNRPKQTSSFRIGTSIAYMMQTRKMV
jgi:uracil-DNA glycosylase